MFRDFLLVFLYNVVFHEIGGIRHFPLDPLKGVVMDGKLLFCSPGDPNPSRGEDVLIEPTRELIQEDMEMRCSSFLEFESPEVFEGGPEEAAADLEPSLQVFFDLEPICGLLFVVGQYELREQEVSRIVAQMSQALTRLRGEFTNIVSGSSRGRLWHCGELTADNGILPIGLVMVGRPFEGNVQPGGKMGGGGVAVTYGATNKLALKVPKLLGWDRAILYS